MKSILLSSVVCLMVTSGAWAAYKKEDACQAALLKAETIRNATIYDSCGFNDSVRAFSEWAPWAEKNNAGQALYELCVRYPNQSRAERLCQRAVDLGNASAKIHQANRLFNQQEYTKAAELYADALTSPMVSKLEKGQVAQNMGLLYMNPDTNYYNPTKGLPLIQKAVEQRGAEANNLMGVYAMFGLQGIKQDAESAFKYFWRAALLGCPAAEENLGLFYLGHQKRIDNKTLKEEMSKRMFSCVASVVEEEEEFALPEGCDCSKAFSLQGKECSEACLKKMAPKKQKIIPYHFTFTSKECADILYYAERLVDTKLPFTGKTQCGFSSDMDKASELLKNL